MLAGHNVDQGSQFDVKGVGQCRDEVGEYFALDIGGTNFRVIHVTLSMDKGEVVSHQRRTLRFLLLQSSEAIYLAPLSSCWTLPVAVAWCGSRRRWKGNAIPDKALYTLETGLCIHVLVWPCCEA